MAAGQAVEAHLEVGAGRARQGQKPGPDPGDVGKYPNIRSLSFKRLDLLKRLNHCTVAI